ncbi:hypothetical protein [Haloterrigena alkaliphila]|uniref:Uncharacterized protein n=1 Tax=Haloterrigena alkaliphila TaxID=2816475 RepID=A0A8A2VDZ1_9EURY|nr:hypothetical protein [Haloterrigena alkaliphila]QSW98485.1 hypothetical protein J0X25_13925 [Haloterrigena alkaliphila]
MILGTGAAGFDFDEGVRYVCEEVREYESSVADTRAITYSQREYADLESIAEERR